MPVTCPLQDVYHIVVRVDSIYFPGFDFFGQKDYECVGHICPWGIMTMHACSLEGVPAAGSR